MSDDEKKIDLEKLLGKENLLDGEELDPNVFHFTIPKDLHARLVNSVGELVSLSHDVYANIIESNPQYANADDVTARKIERCALMTCMAVVGVPWGVALRIIGAMTEDTEEFTSTASGAWQLAKLIGEDIHDSVIGTEEDENADDEE